MKGENGMEKFPYEDILYLPHHVSSKRAHMSMINRGAQFSPFAALTGYDAAIRETGRLTDFRPELADGGREELDEKLRQVTEQEYPEITVTVFEPDERKDGGSFVKVSGTVKRVDLTRKLLLFTDGRTVFLGDLTDIQGEWMKTNDF